MKKAFVSSVSVLLLAAGLAVAGTPPQGAININKADEATLAATPGIGKHKAKEIVDYRQSHGAFKEVHDLTLVKGVSEKALQNILKRNPGKITVSG